MDGPYLGWLCVGEPANHHLCDRTCAARPGDCFITLHNHFRTSSLSPSALGSQVQEIFAPANIGAPESTQAVAHANWRASPVSVWQRPSPRFTDVLNRVRRTALLVSVMHH
jgi:hypothetical protein